MPCSETISNGIIQTVYAYNVEVPSNLLLTDHHPQWFAETRTDPHIETSLCFTSMAQTVSVLL